MTTVNKRLLFIKRCVDLVISAGVLVAVFPPLYLVLGLIIKIDSRGPVIFRQIRTGFRGSRFVCYKFRSMRLNENADTRQAAANDPRITRVGRFLRRLHIDEVPQFYNVFKGEMSVIGPRPHMLAHTEEFARVVEGYGSRHDVRPGITGLAQINGFCGSVNTEAELRRRVRLDVWYARHISPVLDSYIFLSTIFDTTKLLKRLRRKFT